MITNRICNNCLVATPGTTIQAPCHVMKKSSNGNIFRVTGPLCGEFTGPRWIPRTKASNAELWCFFDLHLNKRLSKQSWGWRFEMPSQSLWRHCNVIKSPEFLWILGACIWNLHLWVPDLQLMLQWFNLKIGHQDSSPSNDHHGTY